MQITTSNPRTPVPDATAPVQAQRANPVFASDARLDARRISGGVGRAPRLPVERAASTSSDAAAPAPHCHTSRGFLSATISFLVCSVAGVWGQPVTPLGAAWPALSPIASAVPPTAPAEASLATPLFTSAWSLALGVTLPSPGTSAAALLAQLLPDARSYAAFGWWWIVLVGIFGGIATIVGLVLAVWTLVERIRGRQTTTIGDQPLQVAAAVRWARHDELHQLRSEFDQFEKAWTQNTEALRAKIDEKFSESIHACNSSASKVHSRIDAMAGVQGQLMGKVEQMNENIRLLLQRMGERKS